MSEEWFNEQIRKATCRGWKRSTTHSRKIMKKTCQKNDGGGEEIPDEDIFYYGGIEIWNPTDLQRIGSGYDDGHNIWTLDETYSIMTDIDMTGLPFDVLCQLSANAFKGKLYGNGFKIINLSPTSSTATSNGLFAYAQGAEFINIIMDSPKINLRQTYSCGSILGNAYLNPRCIFRNCGVIGNITVNIVTTGTGTINHIIGALCGGGNVYMHRCYNKANINIPAIGGIAQISGVVQIGGIGGSCYGAIEQCYNSGDISVVYAGTGASYLSGINSASSGMTITNCYNTGNITGEGTTVGGTSFTRVAGITANPTNTGFAFNCYNTGNMSAIGGNTKLVGGMTVSNGTLGAIVNCILLRGTVLDDAIGGPNTSIFMRNAVATATEMKPTLMQIQSDETVYPVQPIGAFVGWDFTHVWNIDGSKNNGFPFLRGI